MINLIAALNEFRDNATIEKTGINTFHNNSKYHTIDDLLKGLRGVGEFGLHFYQTFEGNDLITYITHPESGEEMNSRIHIGDYNDAQKWAGAVTYKRRIALVTMFGLSEPDADGNETINTSVPQSKKKPSATPSAPKSLDFDYSGAPYRLLHIDGSKKAEFTDIKAWGLAMKKALTSTNLDQRLAPANAPEIERVHDEVLGDDLLHHKTKESLLRAINGLKELVPNA